MVPVLLVAATIDDLTGGGFAPFLVIIGLIGAAGGAAMGAVLRPGTGPQGNPSGRTSSAMRDVAPAPHQTAAPLRVAGGR
jgi:hypothetical protein